MYLSISLLGPTLQRQTPSPEGKPGIKLEAKSLRPRPRKRMGYMGSGDGKLAGRTVQIKCLNLFLPATSRH